jgi:hypothetical protein
MPRALKERLVEVAEEVGRVPREDWDKLLCGDDDGLKGYLKFLAIREPRCSSCLFVVLCHRPAEPLPTGGRYGSELGRVDDGTHQ